MLHGKPAHKAPAPVIHNMLTYMGAPTLQDTADSRGAFNLGGFSNCPGHQQQADHRRADVGEWLSGMKLGLQP